jgi:hypothetical protein
MKKHWKPSVRVAARTVHHKQTVQYKNNEQYNTQKKHSNTDWKPWILIKYRPNEPILTYLNYTTKHRSRTQGTEWGFVTVIWVMPQWGLVAGYQSFISEDGSSMFCQYTGVHPLWCKTASKPRDNSGRVEECRLTSLLGAWTVGTC